MQLNEDAVRSIFILRAANEEALEKLCEFFSQQAQRAVRSACNSVSNPGLQNQLLGSWQVLDELSRMIETAEVWRQQKS